MKSYEKEIRSMEEQLLKEISGMKFSLKKLGKILELEALMSCDNR